jgi:photosystem II stability/assembly factor-like uncharacterized protein
MTRKILMVFLAAGLMFGLSGCISFGAKTPTVGAGLAVFASGDKGATWISKTSLMTPSATTGNIAGVSVLSMAQDPNDTNALYIGTRNDGVFYSYNGADGWSRAGNLLTKTQGKVYALAVDSADKCTVFAGIESKIFRSTDCNRTWENVFTTAKSTEVIRTILVDWYNHNIVYASAADGSIYKSETNGTSWFKLKDLAKDIEDFEMDAKDSRILYIVTRKAGIFKSSDSGANWEDLAESLKPFKSTVKIGSGVEVAKDAPNTVFYLSKFGLLKSVDGGTNWEQIKLLTGEGEIEFLTFVVDPKNSNNLYLSDAKTLYRSFDGGKTWETKKLPSTNIISTLKINQKDSNILYIGFKAPEE